MGSSNRTGHGTEDWINKLPLYQAAMDHEQSIRTSYQSLLTALEAGLFGLFFVMVQLQRTTSLWILPATGLFFLFVFGIACDFRARNYDAWRRHIIDLVRGTELEGDFKEGGYGHFEEWHPFFDMKSRFGRLGRLGDKVIGHWFERLLLPFISIIWLLLLISYC
jgi:hypothetical protein